MPPAVLPRAPALDLVQERGRLVRLCARITGVPDVAEDLAQETLVEALRARQGLRVPAGVALEAELDRRELAALLDRAMALLPPDTRAALVLRYVEELPHAEIAGRLATSGAAVAMRLQRGRLALQRLLATDLRREAAAFGLARESDDESWADTRIWCPVCARRRMQARFAAGAAEFWLRCHDCAARYGESGWHRQLGELPPRLRRAGGHRAIFDAVLERDERRYGGVLRGEPVACWRCGHGVAVRQEAPVDAPEVFRGLPVVGLACAHCGARSWSYLGGLILALAEGRRFWREHQRIRVRPRGEVTVAGRPAYRTVLEAAAGAARLEVVADRESLRVVLLNGREVTR